MKAMKLCALVGTFAVAAVSLIPSAFAGDSTGNTGGSAKLNYNELESHSERGVRLDELFECFHRVPAPSAAARVNSKEVARLTPDKPLGHATLKSTGNKKISKTLTAQTIAKNAVLKSIATRKSNKVAPKDLESGRPVVEALYKSGSDLNTVDISNNSVSSSDTPVISASLDKGGDSPKYKSGEQMVVKVKAAKDCNIIVFDYDSHGTLTQLFPNAYEKNGTLHAGETIEIGGAQSQYTLDVTGRGTERIFVYAYPTSEGSITVAMNPVVNTPFRSVELNVDQYRSLVKDSRTYFTPETSSDRTVSIKAKSGMQATEVSKNQQANKVELSFQIEK